MTTTKQDRPEKTGDREFVISRIFDAPRELIWKIGSYLANAKTSKNL